MSYRRLLVLALIAGLPGIAGAQFTTFIPPKPRVVDSVKAVVAATTQARVDSVTNTQLTNMKTWVDSAAGVTVPASTTADSLAASAAISAATGGANAVVMPNGTRAPATASALPFILLLGGVMLGSGILLFFTAPATAPARKRE